MFLLALLAKIDEPLDSVDFNKFGLKVIFYSLCLLNKDPCVLMLLHLLFIVKYYVVSMNILSMFT